MTAPRRLVPRILGFSGVIAAATVGLVALLRPSASVMTAQDWWTAVLVTAAYAAAERWVFHFEFRREAISFSLSEVPTAFALLYLPPWVAITARALGSLPVLLIRFSSRGYKLVFNGALFAFELAVAYHILQLVQRVWAGPGAAVVAVVPATAIATMVGSVLVSTAIAMVEGGWWTRVTSEMSLSWWIAPMSGAIGAAAVAPSLVTRWLAVVGVAPLLAGWEILRAYGRLEQRHRDLDAQLGFVRTINQSLGLDPVAATAAHEASRLLRARAAAVVVFDGTGRARTHCHGEGLPALPNSMDDPVWRPLLLGHGGLMLDSDLAPTTSRRHHAVTASVLVAPIRDGDGLVGAFVLAGREGAANQFRSVDTLRLGTLADQVAPSLRKAMLHERIEFEARHDPLTSLPNRTSFERLLAACLPGSERPWTVLLMDMDRFKEVNDTLGHVAGDALLTAFGERLDDLLRPDDVLARLAGDEFAVLTRATAEEAVELAGGLLEEVRQPFTIDGLDVVVTVSIGIARLEDGDNDASPLLRRADIAMYAAKHRHTGVETYREDIDRRTPARLSMLGDLRAALDQGDLQVHLQPKLDLASGVVIGVEALARWSNHHRGTVSPEDFVPVAEETGLIKQLTDVVLEAAIEQTSRLHRMGHHLGLAVNLSTHDLLDELLPDRVLRRLDRHGVDPALLTLEITESSLLNDAPRARKTIERLNGTGVRLSVDDFGTGYSSLSYLRHLPVAELKIDRGFVTNLLFDEQDEVIVRSIIDLGHNLGLQVVAEGVETDEVMSRLRGFGCDVAQGFGVCRPVPLDQLVVWLHTTQHPSRRRDPMRPGHWVDDPTS
ncbi:MAG: EAL domain-containing protein [Acidimicrobiaceae bacterium]|nr:EAL domain-containing protein [Ilumatobacter sp.]MCB9379416.1 EAL domain-containing protein [Acidimicrobiaceae bacterium]MCO5331295.1 EAL domain-containing protein [Ilumatobacteraceae bacterium]